ncbi:sugar MFS transporter [Paenibacillus sp. PDC88]|uniref:MFS transporter n=1 Tax=Paenibacillus sp. PDC88 TaxID=1884375 RepID=UPI00089D4AE6|nr:MFS transporter [Paenibacillus sp. PDC88]SDW65025.1 Fucose permease [Paenibacillus sp. PDC88]
MATWFLIIIYLAFISLGLPDSMLGAVWPVMQPDIGASFESAGLLSMIVAAGTIVSSLASGRLIQAFGTGKITLFSCILTAGALIGFSFAPSLAWLIILAIPLGLGAGAVDSALNHYVASNYKAHHMSWLHCFWGIGATGGPIIMSYYIAEQNSWRDGYFAVSMIQFSLVLLLFITLPLWKKVAQLHQSDQLKEQANVEDITHSAPREMLNSKPQHPLRMTGVKYTLVAFLFYCGVEMTVGLWGASYLVGERNVSADTAAVWISLYYGGITIGRFITGFITLKLSNRVLILAGQLIAVLGGLFLLLPLPEIFLLAGFVLIGLGFAPIYPGFIHETPARFGKEHAAKLIGYQMAVAYTGTTFLPPLFGLLATNFGISLFPAAVLLLTVLMLVSSERVNQLLRNNRRQN